MACRAVSSLNATRRANTGRKGPDSLLIVRAFSAACVLSLICSPIADALPIPRLLSQIWARKVNAALAPGSSPKLGKGKKFIFRRERERGLRELIYSCFSSLWRVAPFSCQVQAAQGRSMRGFLQSYANLQQASVSS